MKVIRLLKTSDRLLYQQIYSLRDVEEEPYALCRWLRATKFNADELLKRLEDGKGTFQKAYENNFYPGTHTVPLVYLYELR